MAITQAQAKENRKILKEMFTKQSKLEKVTAALNFGASLAWGIYHGYNSSKGIETGIQNVPSDIAISAGVVQSSTHMLTSFKDGKYDRGIVLPLVYTPAVTVAGNLIGHIVGRIAHYTGI